jgi:hypothetical protein
MGDWSDSASLIDNSLDTKPNIYNNNNIPNQTVISLDMGDWIASASLIDNSLDTKPNIQISSMVQSRIS